MFYRLKTLIRTLALSLDRYLILRVFEPASQKIQTLIGWDCFLQRRFCYLLAAGFILLEAIRVVYKGGLPLPLILLMVALLLLIATFCLLSMALSRISDEFTSWRLEKGFANPAKISEHLCYCRLLYVALIVGLYLSALANRQPPSLTDWTNFWMFVAVYLDACDPLPPGRSKIRALWDTLLASPLTLSHSPAGPANEYVGLSIHPAATPPV